MAILQAYQADLPKDMDQLEGLFPEVVFALRMLFVLPGRKPIPLDGLWLLW